MHVYKEGDIYGISPLHSKGLSFQYRDNIFGLGIFLEDTQRGLVYFSFSFFSLLSFSLSTFSFVPGIRGISVTFRDAILIYSLRYKISPRLYISRFFYLLFLLYPEGNEIRISRVKFLYLSSPWYIYIYIFSMSYGFVFDCYKEQ